MELGATWRASRRRLSRRSQAPHRDRHTREVGCLHRRRSVFVSCGAMAPRTHGDPTPRVGADRLPALLRRPELLPLLLRRLPWGHARPRGRGYRLARPVPLARVPAARQTAAVPIPPRTLPPRRPLVRHPGAVVGALARLRSQARPHVPPLRGRLARVRGPARARGPPP